MKALDEGLGNFRINNLNILLMSIGSVWTEGNDLHQPPPNTSEALADVHLFSTHRHSLTHTHSLLPSLRTYLSQYYPTTRPKTYLHHSTAKTFQASPIPSPIILSITYPILPHSTHHPNHNFHAIIAPHYPPSPYTIHILSATHKQIVPFQEVPSHES